MLPGLGQELPDSFAEDAEVTIRHRHAFVAAGRQIILELTVVLDDSPANVIGTQFVNTAKWDFGRLICTQRPQTT